MGKRVLALLMATAVMVGLLAPAASGQGNRAPSSRFEVEGLNKVVEVIRDSDGIPHIKARNDHDLFFMQGWVHAEDRLFQMDMSRRTAAGTLAEMLGSAALPSDVQFRTFGLRRAAEQSLSVLSSESLDALAAYAAGVNAWAVLHSLPPEYGALELTNFDPWAPVDSIAIGKLIAFGLSFDLDDIDRTVDAATFAATGAALGFDGLALMFEDTSRSAPFDPTVSIPGIYGPSAGEDSAVRTGVSQGLDFIRPGTLNLAQTYRATLEGIPLLASTLDRREGFQGSNEWGVSGALTADGRPLIANDPHLALDAPSTFYEIHLNNVKRRRLDVVGSSFPGVPGVVLGSNRWIAWGATVNPMDVTDVYQEVVVVDPSIPSGFATIFDGNPEPVVAIPETFRSNVLDGNPDNVVTVPPGGGIPEATLIVPRRNNGPIVSLDTSSAPFTALSVQYTGWGPTREIDTFLQFARARNLTEFTNALQNFDVGSQNFIYTDRTGNIAYFTSAEMPLREDLQTLGFPDGGIPPWLIRDGTHTLQHEWLPVTNPQPGQAVPFEILPFDEMPQVVNPAAGYVVNANNDPIGTSLDNNPLNQVRPGGGLYYLNPGYASGFRAGRIDRLIQEAIAAGPIDRATMQRIQANVELLDAEVLVPYIIDAWDNAFAPGADPALSAFGADPEVGEAITRLFLWDFSTPTGIPEGYDASDHNGALSPPTADEIDASVAASIYSVWRGQVLRNTIDATIAGLGLPLPGSTLAMSALRHHLDNYDTNLGVGASGVDFFDVPGVTDPEAQRDVLMLQSLRDALDLLSGPEFAPAFGGSTDQDDYRWGYLHRIEFDHVLGGPFNVPPAGGAFPAPLPGLTGIPVDGGFGAVDASSHSARADGLDDFMFGSGPVRRYVGGPLRSGRISGVSSLPGGESGVLGSPWQTNLLGEWLTNETHPLRVTPREVKQAAVSRQVFRPLAP